MSDTKASYEELFNKTKELESALELNSIIRNDKFLTNFQFYFKESLDLVCIAGIDGFYKEINPAFLKIFGYTKKEILENSVLNFIHPDDIEKSKKQIVDLSQGNIVINFENRLLKKNGEVVTVQWRTSVNPSKEYIYAIGRDISAIKKVEAELLASEKLLNEAQKIAKLGTWEFNFSKNKMVWSKELYAIYEIKKQPNQKLFHEYLNLFSKEDVGVFLNKVNQSIIDKKSFEIEQKAVLANGSSKWVHAIVIPLLDQNGNVYALRGNTQDISQKKENETLTKEKEITKTTQKLKLIEEESNLKFKNYIENAPDGIFVIDENNNYLEVNPAVSVLTGYSKEELLKMSVIDITAAESKEAFLKEFQILLKTGVSKGEYKTICKNGDVKWRSVDTVRFSKNRFLGFFKDITATKNATNVLNKTFDRITDAFIALDHNWCFTFMNKHAGEILNCNPEEIIGKNIWDEFPNGTNMPFYNAYHQALQEQKYVFLEEYYETYDLWYENHIYPSEDGLSVFFKNITERTKASKIVEQKENRFQALVENNEGIISVFDQNFKILFISSSVLRITGWEQKEFEKIILSDYIHPHYLQYIESCVQSTLSKPGTPVSVLFQVKHKEGYYIWLEGILNNKLQDPSVKGIIANLIDVTARKRAIENLTIERDKFAKIAATSPGLIFSLRQNKDNSFQFTYISDAIEDIFGFKQREVMQDTKIISRLIHPEDYYALGAKVLETGLKLVPLKWEYRYNHPTKGLVWHEVNSLPELEPEGTIICHGIITDVTERNEAKEKLIKANRLYLFISQINKMIVRTKDEQTLFKEACSIAVEIGKFRTAWIAVINEETKQLVPVMIAGEDSGYFDIIKTITYDDSVQGCGPGGKAIKEGRHIVCNDIENDVLMLPWKEEAIKRNYHSLMVVPIKKFGKTIGAFTFYSTEKHFFDPEEIDLLEEATGDVGFSLEVFEKEKQKKQAENFAIESEHRYHMLAEISPVGIFRTDASGLTTYVNSRWSQLTGLTLEESLGNSWLNAVHIDDRATIIKSWEKAVEQKDIPLTEYRFVRPDGKISWVMGHAVPEKNALDEIIGYIGTTTDITDRKHSEEEFEKVHQKMKAVLDAIPDMLFEVGIDGRIFNYHSHNYEMLKMPDKGYLGKSIKDMFPEAVAQVWLSAIREALEKGYSTGRQYVIELDAVKYWYELSIAPMQENENNETHFICLSRDISKAKMGDEELLKSKKRYRGLLSNLDAAIIVYNNEKSVIMSNSKASDLLGVTIFNENEVDDSTIDILLVNEQNEILENESYPVDVIVDSGEPIKNKVLGIKNASKEEVTWVLVNGFPLWDSDGNLVEVVISFIDITQRKHMERLITNAKLEAEAANKAKTNFLANMSHEIRTPLNGIIGFTHLLMKSDLGNRQLEYMSTVNESATSLMDIINDVLDFSKIESGKLELDIEKINLFELVNQIYDLFKFQAIQKNINLVLHIDDTIPEFIMADSIRLKQILVNLIGNALKFTEYGQITFSVNEVAFAKNTVSIQFSVKDTGIGIKNINHEKIFNSFMQEDNSTSRKFGGTGLGLAISNQLLALMDSKLELESTFKVGSNFHFTITCKIVKQSVNPPLLDGDFSKDNKNAPLRILSQKRVLIVEDNKINMLLLKTLVKKIIPNGTIFTAINGNEAIEKFKLEQIDAILMDIQMPVKNGYDATLEIRKLEDGNKVPIIAITAGILAGEKQRCFESGMDDYLAKPIIVSELEKIMEKWLK
jgi:PAS domain S-box-containing protein